MKVAGVEKKEKNFLERHPFFLSFIFLLINANVHVFISVGIFPHCIPQAQRNSLELIQNPLLLPY